MRPVSVLSEVPGVTINPEGTEVIIDGNASITAVPLLPASAVKLTIVNCPNLSDLTGVHSGVQELILVNNPAVRDLRGVRYGVLDMRIDNMSGLESLEGLATSLKTLRVIRAPKLVSVKQLPPDLTDLELENCEYVRELELPRGLQEFRLEGSPLLPMLTLTSKLTEIIIYNCANLIEVNGFCPELSLFRLEQCSRARKLNLQARKLQDLQLYDLPLLSGIRHGALNLRSKKIDRCPGLTVVETRKTSNEKFAQPKLAR